jgi:carboxyl-terminal processing protease
MRAFLTLLLVLASSLPAQAQSRPGELSAEAWRADALSIEGLINSQYAYLDRFPGAAMPMSPALRAEAEAVGDRRALLRYAEHAVTALADHHAITGGSFNDSWGLVPSYSDLWIEPEGEAWRITAVREGSPAAGAGVRPGDRLVAIGETSTTEAVAAFWSGLGLAPTGDRAGYAARVLAAGRRDRPRDLTIRDASGIERRLTLPNLYVAGPGQRPPVSMHQTGAALVIRFNDSLGDSATVAAFDAAMATARPGQPIVLDLTDTASGGNTVIARAIMGWFVDAPTAYQIHNLPAEERETGVPRQWIEQVLPRPGKRHHGSVTVRVGRWTGSMGEGLAIGLDALGAAVAGDPMAGLLGAIYDHRLANSGMVIKLPTERLYAVDGTPREAFRPRAE